MTQVISAYQDVVLQFHIQGIISFRSDIFAHDLYRFRRTLQTMSLMLPRFTDRLYDPLSAGQKLRIASKSLSRSVVSFLIYLHWRGISVDLRKILVRRKMIWK